MSTFTDLEKDATSVDGFVNENGLIPTRRNGPKPSYQYLVDGWNAEIAAAILELNKSRGFRVVGTFADGFTYELFNDVGIDADGNSWIYVGAGAPNKVVPAGTVPSVGAGYEQVTFNAASGVQSNTGSVQGFIDSFELKVFQSPTTSNTTLIESYTKQPSQVFEVRKTSDDTLATIYSDDAGAVEIAQNGVDNKSNASGEVAFYVNDGDYYINSGNATSGFKTTIKTAFASVSEMKLYESHEAGSVISTLSYFDGWAAILTSPKGGASYAVVDSSEYVGVVDEMGNHSLPDGKVAVLIVGESIKAESFGVMPDEYSRRLENHTRIQAALLTAITLKKSTDSNPTGGLVHLHFTGNAKVEFGEGVFYIEGNSPFHVDPSKYGPPVSTYNYKRGLTVSGAGKESTIFEMVKGNSVGNQWFYKNNYPSENAYGWDTMTWEGVTFRSEKWQWYDNTGVGSAGSGGYTGLQKRMEGDKYGAFYMKSGGFEKFMSWVDCTFQGFDSAFTFTGVSNVASNHWINCKFSIIRDNVLVLDNGESVAHKFTDCDFEPILGSLIYVSENGGGIVTINGGSIVVWPEHDNSGPVARTTESAIVRIDANVDSLKMRASEYTIDGATFEKYDNKYQFVNIRQIGAVVDVGDVVEPRYPASSVKVQYRYCSFSTDNKLSNDSYNIVNNHDVVTINGNIQANVTFDHCSHNTRHFYKALGQTIEYAGGSQIEFISPRLLWDPVRDNVVADTWEGGTLSDRCDTGQYVRFKCTNAIPNFSPQWASKKSWFNLDFDINTKTLNSPFAVNNKLAIIKPDGHSVITNVDTAGVGNRCSMPKKSVIVGWEVYVPDDVGKTGTGDWKVYKIDGGSTILSEPVNLSAGVSKVINLTPSQYITLSDSDPRLHAKYSINTTSEKPAENSYIKAIYR